MDDCIPPGNFFTPKRPSFRMTPGPPPPHSTHQTNSRYNMQMSMNQQRRVCYQNGMTPPYADDHRRFHGGLAYHNQRGYGCNGYVDRFGRVHEPGMPSGYGRYNQGYRVGYGYGNSPVRGFGKRWGNRGDKSEVLREVRGDVSTSPSSGTTTGESRRESPDAEVTKGIEVDLKEREGQGSPVDRSTTQQAEAIYNYDSPESSGRQFNDERVQPIQYNDEMVHPQVCQTRNEPHNEDEIMKVVMQPYMVDYESYRVFDQQPVFMEQMHQQQIVNPEQAFVHAATWTPPMDQLHLLQNIHPAMLYANNSNLYGVADQQRFIDVARGGYDLFRNDFLEEKERVEFHGIRVDGVEEDEGCNVFKLSGFEVVRNMGVEGAGGEFKNVRFCVDNRDFVDTREVVNLVREGEKEYKLFEDGLNPIRDVMKEVYNSNSVDFMDAREICGVKVLPKTLRKWPLDVIGANWETLRKRIVNFNVWEGEGDAGREFLSDAGEFGVEALARFFASWHGGMELPLGVVMLIGMNVDKVVRDLDGGKGLTCGFPGPLADRNLVLDFGGNEVMKGFKEYDLPFDPDGDSGDAHEWTVKHRITRKLMKLFPFETILFMFYTFTGDALQLLAANEAYERGWRYHKVYQVWISPWVDGVGWDVGCKDGSWESGVYKYFHYGKWVYCKAEFKISGGVLEGEPGEVFDALWD